MSQNWKDCNTVKESTIIFHTVGFIAGGGSGDGGLFLF